MLVPTAIIDRNVRGQLLGTDVVTVTVWSPMWHNNRFFRSVIGAF